MNQKNPAHLSGKEVLGYLTMVFVFLYGYVKLTGYDSEGVSPAKSAPTRNISSYVGCQMAIENQALDKSEVDVPLLKGQRRSDGSWEYYWGASTSPLRMPNKFCHSLIIEGTCVANEAGQVISLIIDGNKIK